MRQIHFKQNHCPLTTALQASTLAVSLLVGLGFALVPNTGLAAEEEEAPAAESESADSSTSEAPATDSSDTDAPDAENTTKDAPAAEIQEDRPEDDTPVVATVGKRAIHEWEVSQIMAPLIAGRQLTPESLASLKAHALSTVVDKCLVTNLLLNNGNSPVKPKEIDAEVAKLQTKLSAQKLTLDQFLEKQKMTMQGLRDRIAWQLLWERAVRKYVTDKVLESYFKAKHKEFDGSQVRASHILFRADRPNDPKVGQELLEQAKEVRDQIEAGKITFADAVTRYSAGPSRDRGGDIGFLPRHGIMEEAFSQAAFALEKGQVSQPVPTSFGVHLIKVTDIQDGSKTWNEVREEMIPLVGQSLFDNLAGEQRERVKITYSDNWPHYKPGTMQVAEPGDDEK